MVFLKKNHYTLDLNYLLPDCESVTQIEVLYYYVKDEYIIQWPFFLNIKLKKVPNS